MKDRLIKAIESDRICPACSCRLVAREKRPYPRLWEPVECLSCHSKIGYSGEGNRLQFYFVLWAIVFLVLAIVNTTPWIFFSFLCGTAMTRIGLFQRLVVKRRGTGQRQDSERRLSGNVVIVGHTEHGPHFDFGRWPMIFLVVWLAFCILVLVLSCWASLYYSQEIAFSFTRSAMEILTFPSGGLAVDILLLAPPPADLQAPFLIDLFVLWAFYVVPGYFQWFVLAPFIYRIDLERPFTADDEIRLFEKKKNPSARAWLLLCVADSAVVCIAAASGSSVAAAGIITAVLTFPAWIAPALVYAFTWTRIYGRDPGGLAPAIAQLGEGLPAGAFELIAMAFSIALAYAFWFWLLPYQYRRIVRFYIEAADDIPRASH